MNPVRKLRQEAGLKQAEAAEKAGISQQLWSEIELRPSLLDTPYGTIERIAGVFGVPVEEVVHGKRKKRRRPS